MMYGSVLSGALAGHVHGTAAYDVTSTGEPAGWRPHIWTALRYESGAQMRHLHAFVLCEGIVTRSSTLASQDLEPRSIPDALADGLDGWSFLMRTADKDFALAYFENRALHHAHERIHARARLSLALVRSAHRQLGTRSRSEGGRRQARFTAPAFAAGGKQATRDVAAKIVRAP